MKFEEQDVVHINVYSIDYLLRCIIEKSSEQSLKLQPVSGKIDMLQISDPVVIIYSNENQIKTVPGDVASLDSRSCGFEVIVRNLEVNQDRRVFERYPVSLAISARKKYSNKRLHMLVRNLSLYGMGVISPVDLELEELIDIDLITEKNMFYFNGKVVWKNRLNSEYLEYGMQLTNYDIATQYQYQEYLKKQMNIYMAMIPKGR